MRSRRLAALVAPVLVVLALSPATGRAACEPATAAAEAAAIRAHLAQEARRARRWDVAWGLTLGAITAVQGGLIVAEYKPLAEWDDVARASLAIGAINAGISTFSHFVLPLRITQPGEVGGDACAELAAAEAALAASARAEATAFYMNHVGNLALNGAGLLWLGLVEDDWTEGFTSFALGYGFGLIVTYTQPRASWQAHREGRRFAPAPATTTTSWQLAPVHAPGFTGLAIAGVF